MCQLLHDNDDMTPWCYTTKCHTLHTQQAWQSPHPHLCRLMGTLFCLENQEASQEKGFEAIFENNTVPSRQAQWFCIAASVKGANIVQRRTGECTHRGKNSYSRKLVAGPTISCLVMVAEWGEQQCRSHTREM